MTIFINNYTKLTANQYKVPNKKRRGEKRGFLYLLSDTQDLDYLKIGRTADFKTRLYNYNTSRSRLYCVEPILISRMFQDVIAAENTILFSLRKKIGKEIYKNEWFPAIFKEKLIEAVSLAEVRKTLLGQTLPFFFLI